VARMPGFEDAVLRGGDSMMVLASEDF